MKFFYLGTLLCLALPAAHAAQGDGGQVASASDLLTFRRSVVDAVDQLSTASSAFCGIVHSHRGWYPNPNIDAIDLSMLSSASRMRISQNRDNKVLEIFSSGELTIIAPGNPNNEIGEVLGISNVMAYQYLPTAWVGYPLANLGRYPLSQQHSSSSGPKSRLDSGLRLLNALFMTDMGNSDQLLQSAKAVVSFPDSQIRRISIASRDASMASDVFFELDASLGYSIVRWSAKFDYSDGNWVSLAGRSEPQAYMGSFVPKNVTIISQSSSGGASNYIETHGLERDTGISLPEKLSDEFFLRYDRVIAVVDVGLDGSRRVVKEISPSNLKNRVPLVERVNVLPVTTLTSSRRLIGAGFMLLGVLFVVMLLRIRTRRSRNID